MYIYILPCIVPSLPSGNQLHLVLFHTHHEERSDQQIVSDGTDISGG